MKGSRNNAKCLANVAAFVIFQVAIVLILAFTVMRVRGPKVRLGVVTVDSFSTSSNDTSSPSFNMRLTAQVTVKNTNFGVFKYGNGTMSVAYDGTVVGDAAIVKGRAKARDTATFNVTVDVTSGRLASTASLGADMNSGVLTLRGDAKVRGKVELLKVMKRKKSGVMDCTLSVNLATRAVTTKCK